MPEAEWNDEHTRVICELFAEQVKAGNRPNTHLKNIGYSVVADKFEQRTGLLYTKLQLKNKWDKLKSDYINWKKLLARGANLGWTMKDEQLQPTVIGGRIHLKTCRVQKSSAKLEFGMRII